MLVINFAPLSKFLALLLLTINGKYSQLKETHTRDTK